MVEMSVVLSLLLLLLLCPRSIAPFRERERERKKGRVERADTRTQRHRANGKSHLDLYTFELCKLSKPEKNKQKARDTLTDDDKNNNEQKNEKNFQHKFIFVRCGENRSKYEIHTSRAIGHKHNLYWGTTVHKWKGQQRFDFHLCGWASHEFAQYTAAVAWRRRRRQRWRWRHLNSGFIGKYTIPLFGEWQMGATADSFSSLHTHTQYHSVARCDHRQINDNIFYARCEM